MCIICTELSKGLIKAKDARRNAQEMADGLTVQHALELMKAIEEAEDDEYKFTGMEPD